MFLLWEAERRVKGKIGRWQGQQQSAPGVDRRAPGQADNTSHGSQPEVMTPLPVAFIVPPSTSASLSARSSDGARLRSDTG